MTSPEHVRQTSATDRMRLPEERCGREKPLRGNRGAFGDDKNFPQDALRSRGQRFLLWNRFAHGPEMLVIEVVLVKHRESLGAQLRAAAISALMTAGGWRAGWIPLQLTAIPVTRSQLPRHDFVACPSFVNRSMLAV